MYMVGTTSRISTIQFLLQNVTFDSNNGQILSTQITDAITTNINPCPEVETNDYINGEIEFIDCKFKSNTANNVDSIFMQYYWSLIEIGESNSFINNNNYNTLIQLIDSTITLDNIQFDNNSNIHTVIEFSRELEIRSTTNEFCALNLNILNTNSANNAFIYFTQVTNNDLLSITKSQILSSNLNAFISGYAALNQNAAIINLNDLYISDFGGSFINFNENDKPLINIHFSDSQFNTNGEQLIFINTLLNTAKKSFTFNNISLSDVIAPTQSLFDINSNGGTEIDLDVDYLTFSNVNTEYYFDINGSINFYLGKNIIMDKSDGFLRATNVLNIQISDLEFSVFDTLITLFEVYVSNPTTNTNTQMIVNNTKMYNGQTVLKSYLSPGISPTTQPTIAPTQPPPISPSIAPTQPPSISPSIAPTNLHQLYVIG